MSARAKKSTGMISSTILYKPYIKPKIKSNNSNKPKIKYKEEPEPLNKFKWPDLFPLRIKIKICFFNPSCQCYLSEIVYLGPKVCMLFKVKLGNNLIRKTHVWKKGQKCKITKMCYYLWIQESINKCKL